MPTLTAFAAVDLAGDVEQIVVGLVVALLIAAIAYGARVIRRLNQQDTEVAAIKTMLTRQFGTNGFVLKNEVQNLREDLAAERRRFDGHLEDHARH